MLACKTGAVLTVTDSDVRSLYLDLLRRNLTRYGVDELEPVGWSLGHPLKVGNLMLVNRRPFDQRKRDLGGDWPAEAETMIGMHRLTSLQRCVETVLAEDIPGDLVECGVWRGGACILMRAVLAAYGDETRCVWLADSFEGLPRPDTAKYKADKEIKVGLAGAALAVPEAEVKANFQRYGLLDDRVRFLPGWFKDTLPDAPIDRIAVLRLDGDLYESTIQALDALYPRLSPGGFCIIDDYLDIEACRQAVADYRAKNGISAEIFEIDESGPVGSSRRQPASAVAGQHGPRTGMKDFVHDRRDLSSGRCGGVLWRKE
ncbi:MAG TPA: TylF/MycF/NovP-related O-methyltransferase [Mycobacterium sp.]|nr:TylF/MycF/NovP-related O-methyltransferase [Mycobacterium sp.]